MMRLTAAHPAAALFLGLLFAGLVSTQYSFSSRENDRRSFDPTLEEQLERGEEGMASRQVGLLLVAAGGCGILWLARRNRPVSRLGATVPPLLLAVAGYALASAVWADAPSLSAKRWIAALLMGVGAWGVGAGSTEQGVVRLLFACALLQATGGLVLEAATGSLAPFSAGYRFAGGLHPNGQAVVCALLVASGLAMARGGRTAPESYVGLGGAALGLPLLLLTRSRTAFAAAAVTAFLVLMFAAAPGRRRITVLVGAALLCLALALPGSGSVLMDGLLLGRTTDTDRTPIWQDCLEYVAQRPLWGYGYNGFWTPEHIDEVASLEHWGVSEAHSSYLEILLDGGVAGAALDLAFFGSILVAAWRQWKHAHSRYGALFLAVLLFAALHGLLESQAVRPTLLMFVTLAAVAQIATRRTRMVRVVQDVRFRAGALVSRSVPRVEGTLGRVVTTSAEWK